MIRRTSIDPKLKIVNGQIKADVDFVTVNEFSEASAKQFASDVADIVDNGQEIVPIVIDSYGGEVYSLLAMLDTLKHCGLPVMTYVSGKAMSCGAVLLARADVRFAAPSATIMLHEVSSGSYGKNADIKADAAETERINNLLFWILDDAAKKRRGYFQKLYKKTERVDLYLTAAQAKQHGLIDHVGVPSFQIDVSCKVQIVAGSEDKRK